MIGKERVRQLNRKRKNGKKERMKNQGRGGKIGQRKKKKKERRIRWILSVNGFIPFKGEQKDRMRVIIIIVITIKMMISTNKMFSKGRRIT